MSTPQRSFATTSYDRHLPAARLDIRAGWQPVQSELAMGAQDHIGRLTMRCSARGMPVASSVPALRLRCRAARAAAVASAVGAAARAADGTYVAACARLLKRFCIYNNGRWESWTHSANADISLGRTKSVLCTRSSTGRSASCAQWALLAHTHVAVGYQWKLGEQQSTRGTAVDTSGMDAALDAPRGAANEGSPGLSASATGATPAAPL